MNTDTNYLKVNIKYLKITFCYEQPSQQVPNEKQVPSIVMTSDYI